MKLWDHKENKNKDFIQHFVLFRIFNTCSREYHDSLIIFEWTIPLNKGTDIFLLYEKYMFFVI